MDWRMIKMFYQICFETTVLCCLNVTSEKMYNNNNNKQYLHLHLADAFIQSDLQLHSG